MDHVEDRIIHSLNGQQRPLMIKEIAEICGMERHTVSRRLDRMEILGRVRKLEIGNSKRFFLNNSLPISNLVDISSDLILVINNQWRVQYINRSAKEFLNPLNRPLIGERVDDLKLELFSSPPVIEGLKRFDHHTISKIQVSCYLRGIERHYEISIIGIPFKPGTTSTVIIAVDISEKESLKKQLLESEERFRALFEFSPIAINEEDWSSLKEYLDTLSVGDISDLNEYLKCNPDELRECISRIQIIRTNKLSNYYYRKSSDTPLSVKHDILPYIHEESYDALRKAILSIYKDGTPQKCEISVNTRNGVNFHFLVHSKVIQNDFSNMSRVFTTFQDITDYKLLQTELTKKQEIMLTILEELIQENYTLKEKFHFFH